MNETKSWYRSRTIWGALVALGATLAGAFGVGIDAATSGEIAGHLADAGVAVGALLAILGRIRANTRIG